MKEKFQRLYNIFKVLQNWTKNYVSTSPARVSIATFCVLIFIGTILLALPFSHATPINFIDAFFTATSAVCVTGLAAVDTATQFNRFGQTVILVLIQIGGLGILTISSAFLLSLGYKIGLVDQISLGEEYTADNSINIYSLIKNIAIFTLFFETLGALLLYFRFNDSLPVNEAIYYSIFHSISSFCNAGFSLFSDSLISYAGDFYVNSIIMMLIITGGIGFLVLTEIKRKFTFSRKMWTRLSLHAKIVLSSSAILILLGFFGFLILEYTNTLASLSFLDKLTVSMFQSVTTRTAGFNSVQMDQLANGTLFLMILLMFIGGASGSMAGGIKVGTISALIILGISRFKGHEEANIFNRRIYNGSITRATGVIIMASFIVGFSILLLNVFELGHMTDVTARGRFFDLLFETVSAFGTVGLSTGITPTLSILGKITIALVMLIGRLGPLTLAMAFTNSETLGYKNIEERIMIG